MWKAPDPKPIMYPDVLVLPIMMLMFAFDVAMVSLILEAKLYMSPVAFCKKATGPNGTVRSF